MHPPHLTRTDQLTNTFNLKFHLARDTREKLIQASHASTSYGARTPPTRCKLTDTHTHGVHADTRVLLLACHAGGKARRTTMPASFHIKSRANRESHGEIAAGHAPVVVYFSVLARVVYRGDADHEVAPKRGMLNGITDMWDREACVCESSSGLLGLPCHLRSRLNSLWLSRCDLMLPAL